MADNIYLDTEDYSQRIGGDAELMCELYQIFLEDSRNLMTEINEAVSNNDAAALKISAHTLKGSSACISAKTIQGLASELEVLAAGGSLQNACALNEKLKECYEGTLIEIRAAIEELSNL